MIIVSWNINGIRAIVKKGFVTSIAKINPDILCIQETKASREDINSLLSNIENYNLYSNSAKKKGYSGTALLSKFKPLALVNDMGVSQHDLEGRIQCLELIDFYLVNVYVPNSGQKLERLSYRKKWDIHFLGYLKNLEKTKPVIVCGDFNVAYQSIDLKNDKSNYNKTAGYTQIEIDGMDNLLKSGFVDAFRNLHPNKVAYTYWSYRFKSRERDIGWRIDYFLVSKSLISKVKSVEILSTIPGSDHCPIYLDVDL